MMREQPRHLVFHGIGQRPLMRPGRINRAAPDVSPQFCKGFGQRRLAGRIGFAALDHETADALDNQRIILRQADRRERPPARQRLQQIAGHAFEERGENAGVAARRQSRNALGCHEAVPRRKARNRRELRIAVRVGGAGVMKLKPAAEPRMQRFQHAEHQRRVLELIEAAGKQNAEHAVGAVKRRSAEQARVNRDGHHLSPLRRAGEFALHAFQNIRIDAENAVRQR